MKKFRILFFAGIVILFFFSCRKIEHLPPEPHIDYTSFTIFDTTDILGNASKAGRLKFHFEDGDGDLGLEAPTEPGEDSTNLFFTMYRKKAGVMTQVADNDPLKPAPYRIPYMERLGQNKILKGTISITFLYLFYEPGDTVKYDFYIKDRALNVSNTVSTNDIVLSVNKVY